MQYEVHLQMLSVASDQRYSIDGVAEVVAADCLEEQDTHQCCVIAFALRDNHCCLSLCKMKVLISISQHTDRSLFEFIATCSKIIL